MIGVVYLGKNPETEERLKYIPGRLVQYATNYKDAASLCAPHVRNEHFILFYEQNVQAEDITAITYLKKKCKNIYIILLTHDLTLDDRKMYQKCGINDTINANSSITELNKKIQFISDREGMMFDDAPSRHLAIQDSSLETPFRYHLLSVGNYHPFSCLYHHGYCHPTGEQGSDYLQVQASRYQLHRIQFPEVPLHVCRCGATLEGSGQGSWQPVC